MSARDQIAIATVLADRGWGKAPQYVVIEDEDPPEDSDETFDWDEFDRRFDELKKQRRRQQDELGYDS